MKAYRTTLIGLVSIVAARTPAQAKHRTLRSAHEAGYYSCRYTDVRCVRAPEFDQWAELDGSGACWDASRLSPTPTEFREVAK